MKSFKDLTSSLQLEAKATYCGRCGTVHVPPSQGGMCPALKKEETEIEEAHQVIAKTKEGETFRSAKYPTKKQAMDMHYKMAKSNKYAKVDTVKVQEESELDEARRAMAPTGQYKDPETGVVVKTYPQDPKITKYKPKPTGGSQVYKSTIAKRFDKGSSVFAMKTSESVEHELQQGDTMSSMEQYLAAIEGKADFRSGLEEKKLTPAEMKKREEVAKAIERENPDMPMSKKMAIATATAKKVAEEAEELDEISTAAKQNYINAAAMDVARHGNMLGRAQVGKSKTAANVSGSKIDKRLKGIATATSKLTKEETEGMHYCAKHVYSERFGEGFVVEGSHAEPDEQGLIEWYDVDFGGTVRRVMTEKVKVMHAEYHNNHKRKMSEEDKPHTIPKTAKEKSLAALAEPKDKITHADVMVGRGVKKEDVDLDEGMGKTLAHAVGKVVKAVAPNWVEKQQRAEDEKIKAAKRVVMDKFTSIAQKDVKKEEVDLEEEQLDELSVKKMMTYRSKATEKLGSEPAKDVKRKEGIRVSGEKVKAMLKTEEVEQIDELSKDTLKSYMGKAAKENLANLIKPGEEAKAKAAKRFSGMMKASEKMAKEEVDLEEAMISYSDFVDKIKSHRKAGHKVVDDKYTSGKATFTTITPDGTGRKVTHTPQGHKMEVLGKMDGEDDGAAEVKPTEKRGRGRPAGSKSGARTQ